MAKTNLTDVTGIGAGSAAALRERGISSVCDLAATPLESLVLIPGFGTIRAAAVIKAAKALVGESIATSQDSSLADQEKEKDKSKKKIKRDKKKRKNKKKKKKDKSKKKKKKK
jgi:hypothetical protein